MKIRDSVLKKFGFRIFYEPYPYLFLKIILFELLKRILILDGGNKFPYPYDLWIFGKQIL